MTATNAPSQWLTHEVGGVLKLASGDTRPEDTSLAPDPDRPIPVIGGNGVMGYSSQKNSEGKRIVIGRVGANCGCVHLVTSDAWITDNALYTKTFSANHHIEFIAMVLGWIDLARFRGQSGQPLITQEPIHSLHLALPPLDEQRRIAGVLQTWDEALALQDRLNGAKERRLSWIRAEVLTGRLRLAGASSDWHRVRLSEVLHEHGLSSTGQEPVFSVSVHKGLVDQIEHLGRSFAAESTDHYNRVLPGDIVYTKSPTGDFPLGIIKQSKVDREVIVSPLYGVFTPETYALGVILDAYFQSPWNTGNYLAPLVQKGAKNTIACTNSRFLEGELMLPRDPAEQEALAELITEALDDIAVVRAHRDALARQKRGLMQKLLTGVWRAPETAAMEAAE